MKKLVIRLKEIILENKEDLQYLLYIGVPTGFVLIILSCFVSFDEVF